MWRWAGSSCSPVLLCLSAQTLCRGRPGCRWIQATLATLGQLAFQGASLRVGSVYYVV